LSTRTRIAAICTPPGRGRHDRAGGRDRQDYDAHRGNGHVGRDADGRSLPFDVTAIAGIADADLRPGSATLSLSMPVRTLR